MSTKDTLETTVVNDTRSRLIEIIARRQFSANGNKIKLVDVATEAGISRQAFNRYYGDLKPYITRERLIGELLGDAPPAQTAGFLVQNQNRIQKLEEQLQHLNAEHKKATTKALNQHITSLMNNDILLLESNEIRSALEKRTLHVAELLKQIDKLQMALTQEKLRQGIPQQQDSTRNHKLVFDMDIDRMCMDYARNKDYDQFDEAKYLACEKILERINKFDEGTSICLALFFDRYLSRFNKFADQYVCNGESTHLLVRLPLFKRTEYLRFLKKIKIRCRLLAFEPYCAASSEKAAQREFMFRNLPPEELQAANTSDALKMEMGFDAITVIKIRQGD